MSALDEDLADTIRRICTPEPWMASAACKGEDVEIFYPIRGEDLGEAQPLDEEGGDAA